MDKKIAVIIERADVGLGGAERSVFELTEAISKLGPEVNILAAKGSMRTARNVHILCGHDHRKRASYFSFAKILRKHLSENHYDIIHSVLPFSFADIYQPRGGTYAESILRNAASYQNKFVESYKKLTAFANFRRSILLRAERKLCRQPNGPTIVAISQYVADQFKQHYTVADDRIVVIPNGVRIHAKTSSGETGKLRSQILQKFGIKEADEPILFLFVAHNFRLKGLAVLIKAVHLVTQRGTDRPFFLIIVGGGREHKYCRLARKLNVREKIIFLGSIKHIQNVLSASDVAILPTFYDPSSRYILEALAAKKPVITTRFNGATDLFVGNRHGKIINSPEDVPTLAEALSYFTSIHNIQKASQAIVADNLREKISISRVAKQLIDLYELILHRKRQR